MSDLIERLEKSADECEYTTRSKLIREAAARIRELEAERDTAVAKACEMFEGREKIKAELAAIEAATIERCAQVCEPQGTGWDKEQLATLRWCASAIRALATPSGEG